MAYQYAPAVEQDLRRLEPIFLEPASIVALESFNEIVHRPSETMVSSLMDLFNHALRLNPPSTSWHQDPLFIVVLLNRLVSHSSPSSPSQPSRARLSTTFQEFLPIFINLEFNCPFHPELFERLKKHLTICMTKLAIRMVSSYHFNVDPIAEIINPLRHLTGLEEAINHPQLDAISACLAVIKNVLSFFDHDNSVNSDSLCQKITKSHFQSLYEIYNQLVIMTFNVVREKGKHNEYQKLIKSTVLLLKIFKFMVKPLKKLSSISSSSCDDDGDDDNNSDDVNSEQKSSWILECFSKTLMNNFQQHLDLELSQIFIPELETFSSHISLYGDIMLQIQSYEPSIITRQVLMVYLKIVEYVSTQLVQFHNSFNVQVGEDCHNDSLHHHLDQSSDASNQKRLIKFYPLLNQGLKLLNDSLNPWNSYNDESFDRKSSTHSAIHDGSSGPLDRNEIIKLIEILQPLLNFQFGLESYLDGRTQHQVSDDSDESSSDENSETSMEIEDDQLNNQTDEGWEHEGIDLDEADEEDQSVKDESEDQVYSSQDNHVENLANHEVFNQKIEEMSHSNLTFSILDTHHNSNNRNLRFVSKEPLQIEIEDLIENLRLIDQNNH